MIDGYAVVGLRRKLGVFVLSLFLGMAGWLVPSQIRADTFECGLSEDVGKYTASVGSAAFVGLSIPSFIYLSRGKGPEVGRIIVGSLLFATAGVMMANGIIGIDWSDYSNAACDDEDLERGFALGVYNIVVGSFSVGIGLADLLTFKKERKVKVAFLPGVMRDRSRHLIPTAGAVVIF